MIMLLLLGQNSHIEMMGDKIEAKKIMKKFGVPTVPGSEDEIKNELDAIKLEKIGFPVLLKASAGGGGRAEGCK